MKNVARYINGLTFSIQDAINLLSSRIVGESYQLALKVDENISRKQIKYPRDISIYFKIKIQHDKNNSIQVFDGREGSPPSESLREYHSHKRRK